jgi:hypothetical protein
MPSERLRSGAESEPSRRQTDRQVALTCEGVEHTHHAGGGIAVAQGPDSRGPARHPRRSGPAKLTLQRPCSVPRSRQLSPSRTMRQVMTTRCLNVRSDKIVSAPVPTLSAIMIAHAGM